MKPFYTLTLFILCYSPLLPASSQTLLRISGTVTDQEGNPLPYAGIYLKGSTEGTSTNGDGKYFLKLAPGDYTIVCRYLGFEKAEQEIRLSKDSVQLDFRLRPVAMQIQEVVVHGGGEDPAYAIIRRAISKRPYYEKQPESYACKVYIKDLIQLRNGPEKFLGKKVDYEGEVLDSSHSGILYLSESLDKLSRQQPDKEKLEVISSRQSGGGMGISFPVMIGFYANNVNLLSRQLSPRGYVSPIADQALHYYRYHLEGTFVEDGHTINRIKVMPRRSHEPLFAGYINIMDSSWRIHSLDLLVTKQQQLEMIDSLQIRQIYAAVNDSVWQIRNQSLQFKLGLLNLDLQGAFVNVYSDYDLHPGFPPHYFDDRVLMRYDSLADKRSLAYWDSTRLLPLEHEEMRNFHLKDSIAQARRDSMQSRPYLDSLQKHQPPLTLMGLLWKGYSHNHFRKPAFTFRWNALLKRISYNTVEGLVTRADIAFSHFSDSTAGWLLHPDIRYGWNNHHLNPSLDLQYYPKGYRGMFWELSGGKRVSQFNHDNPIDPLTNSLYTLLLKENYMKIYENYFAGISAVHGFAKGWQWKASLTYEDRLPLQNTSSYSLIKYSDKQFLPNHPYELADRPFQRQQAVIASVVLNYQPGQRYIQYPKQKVAIGSRAPVFGIGYTKGIKGVLGSDVDYDKWFLNIRDEVNLHLLGTVRYKVQTGGFLNRRSVGLPDLQHFNGNQTFYNIRYLNSFQLAPYYAYSNDAPFYTTVNAEYHLNGLLTNKIPLFNRLHWNLVAGSNAFYVNPQNNYWEAFVGLENILKVLRVDLVGGYQSRERTAAGIRIGLDGLLGGALRARMQ